MFPRAPTNRVPQKQVPERKEKSKQQDRPIIVHVHGQVQKPLKFQNETVFQLYQDQPSRKQNITKKASRTVPCKGHELSMPLQVPQEQPAMLKKGASTLENAPRNESEEHFKDHDDGLLEMIKKRAELVHQFEQFPMIIKSPVKLEKKEKIERALRELETQMHRVGWTSATKF